MEEDEKKNTLRDWGIIKTYKHLQIYYDIKPLLLKDKLMYYGNLFIQDFLTIIKLKEERAIIRFIKRARSKRNQIIIADTFLAMRNGFKQFTTSCEDRLINLCTQKNEECSLLICPDASKYFPKIFLSFKN